MPWGHRPKNAKTRPSRSGRAEDRRRIAIRVPRPVCVSPKVRRCRPHVQDGARRLAGQMSGPLVRASRGTPGRCDGFSPMPTARNARRMVGRSCGSRTSSWRRNSARATSGLLQKEWISSPGAFYRPAGCDESSGRNGQRRVGRRSRRRGCRQRSGEFAHLFRTIVSRCPFVSECLGGRAATEPSERALEPATDSDVIVRTGQVADDKGQIVELGRDRVRSVTDAENVASRAGPGDTQKAIQQTRPQRALQGAPFVFRGRRLLEGPR